MLDSAPGHDILPKISFTAVIFILIIHLPNAGERGAGGVPNLFCKQTLCRDSKCTPQFTEAITRNPELSFGSGPTRFDQLLNFFPLPYFGVRPCFRSDHCMLNIVLVFQRNCSYSTWNFHVQL